MEPTYKETKMNMIELRKALIAAYIAASPFGFWSSATLARKVRCYL